MRKNLLLIIGLFFIVHTNLIGMESHREELLQTLHKKNDTCNSMYLWITQETYKFYDKYKKPIGYKNEESLRLQVNTSYRPTPIALNQYSETDLINIITYWDKLAQLLEENNTLFLSNHEDDLIRYEPTLAENILIFMFLSTQLALDYLEKIENITPDEFITHVFNQAQFLFPFYNELKQRLTENQIEALNKLKELLVDPLRETAAKLDTLDAAKAAFVKYSNTVNPLVKLIVENKDCCHLVPLLLQQEELESHLNENELDATKTKELITKIKQSGAYIGWINDDFCSRKALLKTQCSCNLCELFFRQNDTVLTDLKPQWPYVDKNDNERKQQITYRTIPWV